MSKEYLEAFNEIIDKFAEQMMRANKESLTAINKTNAIEYLYRTPQVRLLQQALQHLEAIDNANPNEALEELDYIGKTCYIEAGNAEEDCILYVKNYIGFSTIKQTLIKAQEQEKVLEILFKKQVDLGWLWYCIHECVNSLNEYNKKMPIEKFKLTQEEFDTLKRYCDE